MIGEDTLLRFIDIKLSEAGSKIVIRGATQQIIDKAERCHAGANGKIVTHCRLWWLFRLTYGGGNS